MATFKVNCSIPVHLTIEVDAEDAEEAIEKSDALAHLESYAGNGARFGKLIGTSARNVTLEAGDYVLEGPDWERTAERVE